MARIASKATTNKVEDKTETRRPSTAVAIKPSASAVAISEGMENLPVFMKDDIGAGTENISSEDLDVPRIKLMQGISKELEAFNDLRAGHFFHTATEDIFDKPFLGVPLYMDKRLILWRPLEDGGGILARSDDAQHWSPPNGQFTVKLDRKDGGKSVTWKLAPTVAQSGLHLWGSMNPDDPNSPPAATLMYNVLLAFPEHPEIMPAVITFQRSSLKSGKHFNTKIKTIRMPIYGAVFRFESFKDKNSAGQEFFNIRTTAFGKISDREMYEQYKGLHESYREAGVRLKDVEDLQNDVGDNEAETNIGGGKDGRPSY